MVLAQSYQKRTGKQHLFSGREQYCFSYSGNTSKTRAMLCCKYACAPDCMHLPKARERKHLGCDSKVLVLGCSPTNSPWDTKVNQAPRLIKCLGHLYGRGSKSDQQRVPKEHSLILALHHCYLTVPMLYCTHCHSYRKKRLQFYQGHANFDSQVCTMSSRPKQMTILEVALKQTNEMYSTKTLVPFCL